MRKVQFALLLTAALLAGCGEVIIFGHTVREGHPASDDKATPATATATTTTTGAATPAAKTAVPKIATVSGVTLSLTSQAAEKVANDSRFNAEALLAAIKSELQSRKLLDTTSVQASTAEIAIDDYMLHPTTNFVIFGATPNTGTLTGNLVLRDTQGNALPSQRIEAQARVSIPESGTSENVLRPLYREFALAVVSSLTGMPVKSSDVDQPPR